MKRPSLRIAVITPVFLAFSLLAGCTQAWQLVNQVRTAAAYVTPDIYNEATPAEAPEATSTPALNPAPTEPPCDRSRGGQVSRESLDSELLGFAYEVSVYTPPCYGEEGIAYPVLYLLHGQGMEDTYWLNLGAAEIADGLIADGAAPFLMVMPREVNDYDLVTDDGFGASVVSELLPWVEANYDVCTERECRAIGGISRGGGWATRLVARNFDTFGALGAHSMGLMAGDWWQIQKHLETRSIDEYPRIWVDRGENDYLYQDIDFFVSVLVDNEIPHEFHIWPGAHTGEYWQAHAADYLAWYAEGWE
jgi:enterochelin esterase-like enzyme